MNFFRISFVQDCDDIQDLNLLTDFWKNNGLYIKFHTCMVISFITKIHSLKFSLKSNENILKRVEPFRDLRTIFYRKFCFNLHIVFIATTTLNMLGM